MGDNKSIDPADTNGISPDDALSQMKNECSQSDDALAQMRNECACSNGYGGPYPAQDLGNNAVQKLSFEQYTEVSLKVFRQISDMMGDFFDSIKAVDSKFAGYADIYYGAARDIAQRSQGKKLSDQEFDDMVGNLMAGFVVSGVGALWSSIKTQVVLEDVKAILRKEAVDKLKFLAAIKDNIPCVLENACEQFENCKRDNPGDFDDLYEKFNAVRLDFYIRDLALFLDATYQAALNNSFQKEYPYPTLFDVNRHMLYDMLLNLDEKHSSDEALLSYHRAAIDKIAKEIINSVNNNTPPSAAAVLFAKDKGLMAVAIHDCNPNETILCSEDREVSGVDPDMLYPDCAKTMRIFFDLYKVGNEKASSSPLAACLFKNEALTEAMSHCLNFVTLPEDFKKRMIVIFVNMILGGLLAFLIAMTYGIKWYWALAFGVVGCILVRSLSGANSIREKFMKKLNYVERTIKVTAKRNAGYSESIDLHAIQTKNKKTWVFGVIGALVGCLGGPFGFIVGLLIGVGISALLSESDENYEEYDYREVSTGKAWKGYAVMGILVIGIIFTVLAWMGDNFGKGHSSSVSGQDIVVSDTVVCDSAVNTTEVSAGQQAVIDLYSIYYPSVEYGVDGGYDDGSPFFSDHMKQMFKDLGISRSLQNEYTDTYTKSFNQLFEKVGEMEQAVGSLIGLDADLLLLNQEQPTNLDLKVENVQVLSDDNVKVSVAFSHGTDYKMKCKRTYIMKRENGSFRIDDIIDDGKSTREFLNEEMERAKKDMANNALSSPIHNWTLKGNLGEYPVVFYLDTSKDGITGKYAYLSTLKKYGDRPESYFYLSGSYSDGYVSLTSREYKKNAAFEYINLNVDESPNGVRLSGTLRNANTNHEYPLELRLQ